MSPSSSRYGCNVSPTTCPWNVKFATVPADDSPYRAREVPAGKNSRQLAREVPAMDAEGYRAAFRGPPMKRAKLPATKRDGAVVLGDLGTPEDVDVLTRALADP